MMNEADTNTEHEAISLKAANLQTYIDSEAFRELDEPDQSLYIAQLDAMKNYDSILVHRLARFNRFDTNNS